MFAKLVERSRNTLFLRSWSLFKVPLIALMGPRVIELNARTCEVMIPLKFLTKNHFNSLYISCQVTGAELTAGLLAMHHARSAKLGILFKDFHGQFNRRPDADTLFKCTDGEAIAALVAEALASGERREHLVEVEAVCPGKWGNAAVANFSLTLTVKRPTV